MRRRLAATYGPLALLATVGLAGCSDKFLPPSLLDDLRVLAIVADPLELAPGQPVTARRTLFLPPGSAIATERWTFCPLTAGAVANYACAVPQCEVTLEPAPDGSVTANPTEIVQRCLGGGTGVPPQVPNVIQTVVRYQVSSDAGQSRDAVLQIPQWTRQPPPDPNLPPVIAGVEIGGVPAVVGVPTPPLPVGGSLPVRFRIDPASVQTYVDAAGVSLSETMTGYFFATAGRFAANLTTGVDTSLDLAGDEIPADLATLEVWLLAVDLRGGQALAGPFTVPVGR